MLLAKTFEERVFVEKVGDKVKISLENPAPTTAFFKGKGNKEVRTDKFEITVPVDFATHLYLALKTIEDGFPQTFYQTEENGEEKRIYIARGVGRKEGYLGIRVVNYTKEEGGAIWIAPGGNLKRVRISAVLEEVLKQFPLLLYKEQDLNIVWQRENRRLVITDDSGEWVELFHPLNLAIYREMVWLFDKTEELPGRIDLVPGVEKREFKFFGIDENGEFTVLGRVYPLALFKRIGYLLFF